MLKWALVSFVVGLGGHSPLFTPEQGEFIILFSTLIAAAICLTWFSIGVVKVLWTLTFTNWLHDTFSRLFPKIAEQDAIQNARFVIFHSFYTPDELMTRQRMNLALITTYGITMLTWARIWLIFAVGDTGNIVDIGLPAISFAASMVASKVKIDFTNRMRAKYQKRYETEYVEVTQGEGKNKVTAILAREFAHAGTGRQ